MSTLITPAYLEEQRWLHCAPRGYGGKGRRWAPIVWGIATVYDCASMLDYGAGQGTLEIALRESGVPFSLASYDPAVGIFTRPPARADLVVCTDVLEHVEADCMDAVIEHIAGLTRKVLFVCISTVATSKTLSDGRQCHISLHDREWWRCALSGRFNLVAEHAVNPAKQWVAELTPKGL